MCGRYVLVQKVETIEKRFGVKAGNIEFEPSYNISPGMYAPVITNENPKELQLFQFGLTPFWAKKPMYLINARSEGDKNKENDPHYSGGKEIITKPAFRKPIRSQRCLVPADAFIEGTINERLSKPFLVYLRDKVRPFAFAGIWDTWHNQETGEEVNSFSIITTVSNSLIQKLPHHRSPVILPKSAEYSWLSHKTSLSDITSLLQPFPAELMNAYPIHPAIKDPKVERAELIKPTGDRLELETDTSVSLGLKLQGMGTRRKPLN